MIAPTEKSFFQIEEQEMLEIAIEANKTGVTNRIKQKIKVHTEKFNWIPYDYGANLYNEEHFFFELHKTLRNTLKEIEEKYNKLKNYTEQTKKEQKVIIKKYDVDELHQKLFAVVRHSYFLIDAKKEFFTKLHLYSQRVFQEVSRRLKLGIDLVRHAFVEEIENYLVKKQEPEVEKLKEREENYYMVNRADGKIDLKQGPEAKKIIDEFLADYEKKEEKVEEIKGRVAQPGKVSGKVKLIINAKECNKIKHGDILVTVMTSPDYMVAVKRAAAIVTDEGGITCHAAIVARELKTPCITGTKNATKLLKDNDLVEVDANKGIVRKIR
ncbi:hypothetical protein HQ533_04965 [Candidatus Woesearchaeota archaeon]|nr:hypothetical protein [Candidatus Woesearchaeota archaeon]